jgi:AraC-like DNA-binding protein
MATGPARFSTAGLPEAQRVALWENHNADALIGLRCRPLDDTTMDATEINLQLPRLHLARVTSNPHVVERTTSTIRRTPAESIVCYLTLVGQAFFYDHDGTRTMQPGQLIICDADRPFMRGFAQGLEELAIKVPRQVFADATGWDSVREPVVRDFAREVWATTFARLVGRAVRPEDAQPVDEQILLDLLRGLVTSRPADSAAVHLSAAMTYIEDRLTDQVLTATRIAHGIGISERHLSRVFSAHGSSVPRHILTRRLERAHALLLGDADLTVGDVAARCGFGSATYFSHAFRDHYGLRATDVRRRARMTPAE